MVIAWTPIAQGMPGRQPCEVQPTCNRLHVDGAASDFDPTLWLRAFAEIGGGYALAADRRLSLIVGDCEVDALTPVMAQIVGHAERQEALRDAIERRQAGEV